MLLCVLATLLLAESPDRTPAIFRCPAAEAESPRLESLIDSDDFRFLCVDPAPGPKVRAVARGKVTFVAPASIDTPANRRWRDATVAMAAGKISQRQWLARTHSSRETVTISPAPRRPACDPH